MSAQLCPICGAGVPPNPRYKAYLCQGCAARAMSADGRPLAFGNVSFSGGFTAAFADTGEPYPAGHVCFVDGVECWADEARFGGIVILTERPRVSPEAWS